MAAAREATRYANFVLTEAKLWRSREVRLTAVITGGTPSGTIFDNSGNILIAGTINAASSILLRPEPPQTVANSKLVLARNAEVNDAFLSYVMQGGVPMNQAQIDSTNLALLMNSGIDVRKGVLPDSRASTSFFGDLGAAISGAFAAAGEAVAGAVNVVLALVYHPRNRDRR